MRDDAGITLILVALMLVVLIIFAAFAVDMGGVYAARRQDQTAADVSALAAAQDLRNGEAAMVATAKTYAHDTLGTTIPDGADGWNSCPRPDPAALASQTASASCISYEGSEVRVRLPDRFYPTAFGGVVGLGDYRHSAFAIAGLEGAGFGGVLPFFTTTGVAANGYDCLLADGPSDCDPATGSFFPLRFSYHTPTCEVGGNINEAKSMLVDNAGAGVDHDLSLYNGDPHGSNVVVDISPGCPLAPNATENFTGNQPSEVRDGLLTGSSAQFRDGDGPRLQRDAGVGSVLPPRITTYDGRDLDNTPLWWFIPENYGPGEAQLADIPPSCKRDQFLDDSGNRYTDLTDNGDLDPGVAAHLEGFDEQSDKYLGLLVRCFDHYSGRTWDGFPGELEEEDPVPPECASGCTAPVFARNSSGDEPDLYDIQYSPRFGYSPVTDVIPSGGSGQIRFIEFRAIYINRLNLGNARSVWDAGFSPTDPDVPNTPQTSVEAFFFPETMLPGGLGGPEAPSEIGVNRFVTLVR
ncbi:Tad domain-containing protein [Rhabdothermincola salaria]|uniref:Tad domain-containing protein n=1 Tax=Rhabdothermincola salaria TaxID=2903142 RepID=UPI001E57B748|nr:Tad domain-containing protein [Rhabdothermincola salaria]MCD9623536.1 pilus assembly protein TadG-related protein [Rhabdothermincola salaria]